MVIYGITILGICTLFGLLAGKLLGSLFGIDANVGGIGIAMFLLMYLSSSLNTQFTIGDISEKGISFDIPTVPFQEYPDIPDNKHENLYCIETSSLKDIISSLNKSKRTFRAYMNVASLIILFMNQFYVKLSYK